MQRTFLQQASARSFSKLCRSVEYSAGKPLRSNGKGSTCAASGASSSVPVVPYEKVRIAGKSSGYELRFYQPRYVLQTAYTSRRQAYMAFDEYLTGKNEARLSLEAPAPVVMRHEPQTGADILLRVVQGKKWMQMFVMSLGTSLDNAALLKQPSLPTNDQISIDIAGGEIVATVQFSGQVTKAAAAEMNSKLRSLLKQDGIQLADSEANGSFRIAQYDPVHSLSERTNEVWLAVRL